MPAIEISPHKIREKSYLLYKIQQKHARWNTARTALLIGAGCSFPILPLGGQLIKMCQQLCFARFTDPVSSAQLIAEFLRTGDLAGINSLVDQKGEENFDAFVKEREDALKERITRDMEGEKAKIPQGAKWEEYEELVLADARYGYWMDEYSESPKERQRFIEALVETKSPSGAYIVLAYLIEKGYFSNILTSNFDDFINDSLLYYTGTKPRFYADDELSQYISIYSAKPNIIKLHGDYRYANIKNTSEETTNLSKRLEVKLRELLTELDIMIIGYNGADYSIMNVLQQVKSPDCELLWCGLDEKNVHWRVAELINKTANSYFVKIKGFDDLMGDFYLEFLKTPPENLVEKATKRQQEISQYVKQFSKDLKSKAETPEEKERLEKQEEIWKLWLEANKKKEFDLQLELMDKILAIDPNSVQAYYTRGLAYYNKGEYDKAIEDCTHALEMNDKAHTAYNTRAIAYGAKGEPEKAIADLNKAIEIEPRIAVRYYNRAIFLIELDRNEKALEDLNKAIELNKDDLDAYNERGNLYYKMDRLEEALGDFNHLIDTGGTKSSWFNNRGNAYFSLAKYGESVADYSRAIELSPEDAMYYYHRGNAYRESPDLDNAIKDYSKAIELDPKYLNAYQNRAKAYDARGDKENEAKDRAMVEQLTKSNP